MTLNLKYIIVEHGAILFPEAVMHSIVASSFPKVYSAGFVNIQSNDKYECPPIELCIQCYGGSESLEIKSNPKEDKIFIDDLFSTVSRTKYLGLTAKEVYI